MMMMMMMITLPADLPFVLLTNPASGLQHYNKRMFLAADCRSKVRLFGRWAAAYCTELPTTNAGQYATLICKTAAVLDSVKAAVYKCLDIALPLGYTPTII